MATSGASCSHGFIKLFGQAILIPSPSSPSNPQDPLVATITDDDQEGQKWRRRRRRRRRAMTLPSHLCMLQAYNASSSQLTTTTTNTSLPLLLRERKKGMPWTEDEHRMFLLGLEKLGKGDWRGISRTFVTSRTPTQVASHAQKYFLRQCSLDKRIKRRSSLFDMISTSSSSSPSSNGHKDNASLLTHANALLSIHCRPASSSSHSEDEPEHHIINVNSSSTLKIQPNIALPMVRRPTTLLI